MSTDNHPLKAKFFENVDKSPGHGPKGDCWVWTKCLNYFGYGKLSTSNSWLRAHRVSYEIHYGPIPDKASILHKCDNPRCVNPEHLYAGTARDNIRDCVSRGRRKQVNQPRGEEHKGAKLTTDKVREIRSLWASGLVTKLGLSRQFKISNSVIGRIISGEDWKHV